MIIACHAANRSFVRLIFIATCLLAGIRTIAQRYHFHNLNVDEGLIQSQATCLAQDKTGNLWIGTLGGLSRYDGRGFTNYTVRNGLLHNTIRAVACDPAGNIWIGGPQGLQCYNGRSFKSYRRPVLQGRVQDPTQQIVAEDDTTWWRSGGEIHFVSKGKMKYVVTPGEDGFVTSMVVHKGQLWIVKSGQLYHFNGMRWQQLNLVTDTLRPMFQRAFRDTKGTVWVASGSSLYYVKGQVVSPYLIEGMPARFQSGILSIGEDNSGTLWLGALTGAIRVDSSGTQWYKKHNGLTDNTISAVFTDTEGSVWMASDGQGIFRFSGTQFTAIDESVGLPSAQVMGISSNGTDSLFLGTYDAGLYLFSGGRVSPLSFPSNPVPVVTALCYTPFKRLWIGTRGRGLWSYKNGIFRQYTVADHNLPSNNVQCLYSDGFARLWIGFSNGVVLLEDSMFKVPDSTNSPAYSFTTIGYDSILIAYESGLRLFHEGSATPFITGTIADSSHVQCFTVSGRSIWLGTSDNGIICYDMNTGKATVINKSDGLRSDFIYNITKDDDGNIWAGTGFGIHRITLKKGEEPSITFYGKAQGVTGMESNINSVLKMPDGSIWFGTTNGALRYDPHTAAVSPEPSSIELQGVKIAGESRPDPAWYDSLDNWYGIPYDLRLPYKKNNIAFTFQAVTLSGGQQILYRYRMDGVDAPWTDWSTGNTVTYSALPPGNYVFRVQCRGEAGTTAKELAYPFEIITPFHKSPWFRFGVFALCILVGIALQYSLNHRKQRRQQLLERLRAEEQVKVRLRTAEDFHDEIGNRLTRINVLTSVLKNKVPMNPETLRILGQIEENTSQLYSGTRDILWSLKPSNDVLFEILHRLREFGNELFEDTDVFFEFSGSDERFRKFRLNMDMSRNLIMICKEALNNVLKYAEAKQVHLSVAMKQKNVLQLIIRDNGTGFDMQVARKGNGLANMQNRAGRLDGKLYIDSKPGKGTIITLTFKIPPNR